jgi:ankyrin repeat protein
VNIDAAQLLIDGGADVSAQDIPGNTPLWRAVFDSRGRGQMIQQLLSAGADKALKTSTELRLKISRKALETTT